MFDISFAELMMIAVVALLVIGPERLPKVARTLGAYTGRLQRYVAQVKAEVNREVRFEELQNLQQEIKQGVNQAEASMMAGVSDAQGVLAKVSVKPKRKPPTKKTTTKKTSVKKPVIKKPTAKKTTVKKVVAKKTIVKKKPVRKTVLKKSTVKQTKGDA